MAFNIPSEVRTIHLKCSGYSVYEDSPTSRNACCSGAEDDMVRNLLCLGEPAADDMRLKNSTLSVRGVRGRDAPNWTIEDPPNLSPRLVPKFAPKFLVGIKLLNIVRTAMFHRRTTTFQFKMTGDLNLSLSSPGMNIQNNSGPRSQLHFLLGKVASIILHCHTKTKLLVLVQRITQAFGNAQATQLWTHGMDGITSR